MNISADILSRYYAYD